MREQPRRPTTAKGATVAPARTRLSEAPLTISEGYSRYALLLLTIVFLVHNLDRQIMSILLVPIQNELGASDTAMGFLTGFAFAAVYVTFGIPMAHLCDHGNRRNILSIVIAVWSGFTALCGTAVNYVHLLLMRVGVALGEAGGNPACVSMISDFFPAARRAMAMGVFYIGASAGIFFGMWLGGWINDAMGWRAAFVVVGLPGVLLALIVRVTLIEPPRGASDGLQVDTRHAQSFMAVQRRLWSLATYRRLILGNACHSIAMYASFAWAAAYFIRIHGLSTTEVGLRIGLVTGLGAALGNLVGGFLTDRLAARSKAWYMGVAGIANLLSVPLVFTFLNLAEPAWAILAYLPTIAFMAASAAVGGHRHTGHRAPRDAFHELHDPVHGDEPPGHGGRAVPGGAHQRPARPAVRGAVHPLLHAGHHRQHGACLRFDVLLGKPHRQRRHGGSGKRRGPGQTLDRRAAGSGSIRDAQSEKRARSGQQTGDFVQILNGFEMQQCVDQPVDLRCRYAAPGVLEAIPELFDDVFVRHRVCRMPVDIVDPAGEGAPVRRLQLDDSR